MTTASPGKQRRVSPLSVAIGILAAIAFALLSAAGIYTDWLWFKQLGYEGVFTTQIIAQVLSFLVGFTALTIIVGIALGFAWKTRPVYIRMPEESPFAVYQQMIDGLRKVIMIGLPIVLGVFGGLIIAREWQTAALFVTGTDFGNPDEQFGLDPSFYIFDLPFYTLILSFLSGALLLSALISTAVHVIYGGIRFTGRDVQVSKPARIQLAILVALYLSVQAVSLWLDQYRTVTSSGSLFTGANYTDANAVIPGLQILALISAVVALAFLVTAFIGRWRISIIATSLLVVSGTAVNLLRIGYKIRN